jgi:putative glycerol-1-phosphate prenyltransferase
MLDKNKVKYDLEKLMAEKRKLVISKVKTELNIPLVVGGGIRTKRDLEIAYKAGADLVVIGTAFEEDDGFFDDLKK